MSRSIPSRGLRASAVAVALTGALALSACASNSGAASESDSGSGDSLGALKVGALATPAGDILKYVDENLADEAGLDIEFVEFTDYNTPSTSLREGSTDANLFQNDTFLANFNSSTGAELVSVGDIYLPTAAFYSDTVSSLDELEDGATIAIPNDPTNEGRALKILAAEGLIETTDEPSTVADVTANPHEFEFVEIENASLPQAVQDSDAAFVTLAFALPAGLTADEAILVEGEDSSYYNNLTTRPELEDDPRIAKLKELLLSEDTRAFIEETWGGLVVPADAG